MPSRCTLLLRCCCRFGAAEMIVEAHDQQQDTKVQVHVNFASQAIGSGAALEAQKMGIRV